MVEPIMFFGIGFLIASLIGLVFMPLVHHRAVRLTLRRLEASTPLSMAEIQADKDQLRAEFAMATRRLEIAIEQLKAKTTHQFAEIGKKTDALNRMKAELEEKNAAMTALETRERALKDQLQTLEAAHDQKHTGLQSAERTLADREAELAKLAQALSDQTVTSDSQRVEIVALRTQIDALKGRIEEQEREVEAQRHQAREARDAAAAARARPAAALGAAPAESEAEETALLRERMHGLAAEVAHLTLALEGPDSPIAAILASESGRGRANGAHVNGPTGGEPAGSLADRIRALQARAAALAEASTPS